MNFLAHATLSFDRPAILVGNMISDFVKGKQKFEYSPAILEGIMLHRMIDQFTDEHPATQEAKVVFKPAYRLYSGAFVDVVYDHFLALDEHVYSASSLLEFSQWVYAVLGSHEDVLPLRFARMFPFMREENWLFHYREPQGIYNSFGGIARRARYISESRTASRLFDQHYQLLGDCYRHFWTDVRAFAFSNLSAQ